MFKDKTLLITGGTGSFGKMALRHFIDTEIKKIKIFSRDEKKQHDMRVLFNNDKIKFHIGDVRDLESLNDAMVGVDFVFHAAALKQVPSCEFHPMEAVKTNVIGTENVLNASRTQCVSKVVVLSTDKAVYPINAMGISKAMAEKLVFAKSFGGQEKETTFCLTRYGNVMASRGSVIPLFVEQIKAGKKLTITDSNMTRFLMSLDESLELVLFAFKHANHGDIFVQKASACTIGTLYQAVSEIFDVDPGIDIIGTRHGEKLYETLVSREEMARAEDMGSYFRIAPDHRGQRYRAFFKEGSAEIASLDDYTSHNTQLLNVKEVKQALLKLDYIKRAVHD